LQISAAMSIAAFTNGQHHAEILLQKGETIAQGADARLRAIDDIKPTR